MEKTLSHCPSTLSSCKLTMPFAIGFLMYILGISTLGKSSAVALLNDRGVLFAIEEEKLTRLQDSAEVPRLALDRCLLENHLKLSEIRAIGLADRALPL